MAYAFGVGLELLVGRLVPFVHLRGQSLRSVLRNMAAKRHKKRKNDEPLCIAKPKCIGAGVVESFRLKCHPSIVK